jgi:RNAse (barnase) inhibitor barstar
MKVIALDASEWHSPEDFYSALLPQLGAPEWHGHNLDALDDSLGVGGINSLEPPFKVEVAGAQQLPEPMRHFLTKVERVFLTFVRSGTRTSTFSSPEQCPLSTHCRHYSASRPDAVPGVPPTYFRSDPINSYRRE